MSQFFVAAQNGGAGAVMSVTGANGVTAAPTTGAVVVSGVNATTGSVGVASFNSAQFTVTAGAVSLLPQILNYTNVTHAMSPYTVLATDYYISVDCSGGSVTLNFPTAPTFKQEWIVKDRTGMASTNHIFVTTIGGAITIDGETTYTVTGNYESLQLLANATPSYEVF